MLLRTLIKTGVFPSSGNAHLQPSRGQGSGVVVDKKPNDGALILLLGYFDNENQARLIKRDGTVVKKWSFDYFKQFDDKQRVCPLSDTLGVDMHGVVLRPNGEIVANYEYCGTVKLDRCGKMLWALNLKTNHSIVPATQGGYWVLRREQWQGGSQPDRLPPFSQRGSKVTLKEDFITRLSEDGKVLEDISIPQILMHSGLEAVLTGNGEVYNVAEEPRPEIVHANKVAELSPELADKFPQFKAGDLVVSIRTYNLLFVVDPKTWRVKWHHTGPYLRQHDAEFRPDGRISVFNNNAYATGYTEFDKIILSQPWVSNIMAIDPKTNQTEVIYGMKKGQEMLSTYRGQHELTPEGGMIITEPDAGRVLEVDKLGNTLWEYVNKYDDKNVGQLTNAYRFDPGYFTVNMEDCK